MSHTTWESYEVNTTYEPFSKEPEYLEANRAFLEGLDLPVGGRLLDLACGTGLMMALTLEAREGLHAVGLDISHESLLLAREELTGLGLMRGPESQAAGLVQASADRLPLGGNWFDLVLMGNAIHMVSDRNTLLSEVRRVLRPGGLFAFNTSFWAGTMVPGTEVFYQEWVKQALTEVQTRDRWLRAQGLPGIRRVRGTVAPAFSSRWPTRQEWAESLGSHGFTLAGVSERTVVMTQHSMETIGAYAGMAEVLLSGFPVSEASRGLQAAAGPALAAVGMTTVKRLWLEIAARAR